MSGRTSRAGRRSSAAGRLDGATRMRFWSWLVLPAPLVAVAHRAKRRSKCERLDRDLRHRRQQERLELTVNSPDRRGEQPGLLGAGDELVDGVVLYLAWCGARDPV